MQAITVTYKVSTNGSVYLVAQCEAGRKRESRHYEKDVTDQALELATRFAHLLNWLRDDYELVQGCTHTGDYVHVLVPTLNKGERS